MSLVPITESAASLIDSVHVGMLSNIVAIVISTVVVSLVGTFVIENIILKRIGKYKVSSEDGLGDTKEIKLESVSLEEQKD